MKVKHEVAIFKWDWQELRTLAKLIPECARACARAPVSERARAEKTNFLLKASCSEKQEINACR